MSASSPAAPMSAELAGSWVPAGLGRRIGAGAIDLAVIFFGATVLLGVTGIALGPAPGHGAHPTNAQTFVASLMLAAFVLGPALYLGLGWSTGATLGMRASDLRVVDARTGDRVSVSQVLLRLAGTVYALVPCGAGLLVAALRPDRRGWQDRISGTAMVHRRPAAAGWVWNGAQWVWGVTTPAASTAPVPTGVRQPPTPRPPRSAWTWTDVVPLLVLFLPAAYLSQLGVVVALHAAQIGQGHPAAINLLLDAVAYGVNLALIWLFIGLRRHARPADVGLRLPRWPWLLAALPALVCAWTAEVALGALGTVLLPASPANQCTAIQSEYHSALLLGLIGVAAVAPVVEEILFRGVVFGWLRGRMPVVAAAVISAALFSVAHIGWMEWSLFLPVFGVGLVLAGLYHHSRSIWPGVLVHGSINTIATLIILLGHPHC